jgi:hypothetical protein
MGFYSSGPRIKENDLKVGSYSPAPSKGLLNCCDLVEHP